MPNELTKEHLEKRLIELKKIVDNETVERFRIESNNPRYLETVDRLKDLDDDMQRIATERAELLSEQERILFDNVPDSRPEFQNIKLAMIQVMKLGGLERFGSAVGKFSTKKAVNAKRLDEDVLQGDTDEFLRVVTVTQKALTDFAADRPEIKRAVLGCIEITSRELDDIDIEIQA